MTKVVAHYARVAGALAGHRRNLIGLALLRVGLGIAGLTLYLSNLADRHFLWGPNSYWPAEYMSRTRGVPLSIYALAHSTRLFDLLFVAGIAAAVGFIVRGGRVWGVLHAVFLWSLYERNGTLLDGGDNLARIMVLLLLLTASDHYLAVGSKDRRAVGNADESPRLRVLAHNAGALLIVFQTAVVYTVAGLWKVSGDRWRGGNALYYITRIDDFSYLPVLQTVTSNAVLLTIVTYATVVIQLAFVPCLLSKRFKWVGLVGVIGMHVGIGAGMGLVTFATVMMAADFACMPDGHYRSAANLVRHQWATRFGVARWQGSRAAVAREVAT